MFQGNRPIFQTNRVLKAVHLAAGMSYPEELLLRLYGAYSDGVLEGAKIIVQEQTKELKIEPGILKWKEAFYWMQTSERVKYQADGKQYYLRVRFLEEQKEEEQILRQTELRFTENKEKMGNELELARFRLKEGASLRQDYQGFWDLKTEHNTLNIIYAEQAGRGGKTLSPVITSLYGKELLSVATEAIDICFAMECLREETISKSLVKAYIYKKLGADATFFDAMQLYTALEQILAQAGGKPENQRQRNHGRKVLVE